jgi:site-specific DNA recombinase
MRAAIYVRVSTDGQERDGTSLDSQERACHELASSAGWQVVACERDTASGYTLDRPGMEPCATCSGRVRSMSCWHTR